MLKTLTRVSEQLVKTIFMNSKKIILTAGVVVVAAAGVFAGAKKFGPTAVYFKTAGGLACNQIISGSPSAFFTTTGTVQAAIKTSVLGTAVSLWSTAGCATHKVFFKN